VARITLQIKNVASLLLATVASASSGIAVKRYFENTNNWYVPALCLALALGAQLALVFVESKEEEELSLIRKQRIEVIKNDTLVAAAVAAQMEKEIKAGNHEGVTAWLAIKEKL
jgi:hypothetical protein